MKVISVDNDIDSNATIKADFPSFQVDSLVEANFDMDYIHASPECRTFSRMSAHKHWSKEMHNLSVDSHEADALLVKLYQLTHKVLRKNKNATVTIENPIGASFPTSHFFATTNLTHYQLTLYAGRMQNGNIMVSFALKEQLLLCNII